MGREFFDGEEVVRWPLDMVNKQNKYPQLDSAGQPMMAKAELER